MHVVSGFQFLLSGERCVELKFLKMVRDPSLGIVVQMPAQHSNSAFNNQILMHRHIVIPRGALSDEILASMLALWQGAGPVDFRGKLVKFEGVSPIATFQKPHPPVWVGGSAAGARNIISSNGTTGLQISDSNNNTVQGNYIGTDATGANALGNGWSGVWITGTSLGNIIGGPNTVEGNIIANNGGASGVPVRHSGVTVEIDLGSRGQSLALIEFTPGRLLLVSEATSRCGSERCGGSVIPI